MTFRKFTEDERAMFLLQLEVLDYPKNEHALLEVTKQKGAPVRNTLKRWWKIKSEPHISKLVQEKKPGLIESLNDLLNLHITASTDAVKGSEDLRAINTGIGILIDKLQLLKGEPTGIVRIVQMIQDGKVKPEAVREKWPNLADDLFARAGVIVDVKP